jgi:uncharacterized membrane protein
VTVARRRREFFRAMRKKPRRRRVFFFFPPRNARVVADPPAATVGDLLATRFAMTGNREPERHRRRDQFVAAASRTHPISPTAILVAAGIVLLAAMAFATRSGKDARPAFPAGEDVSLAASDFDDGQARFYRYVTAAGSEVRFFVMKSSDGVVRAAFDTCDVCFREQKGYRQAGDSMICMNCGLSFPSREINVQHGGCNPAPIERTVEGDRVVLRAAALESGARYF